MRPMSSTPLDQVLLYCVKSLIPAHATSHLTQRTLRHNVHNIPASFGPTTAVVAGRLNSLIHRMKSKSFFRVGGTQKGSCCTGDLELE